MRLSDFLEPYQVLLKHRRYLFDSVGVELRARYAGSMLGLAWIVIGPTLLLVLYGLIYAVVFRVRPVGMELSDYILYIYAGLIPFIAFSQVLLSSAASLTQGRGLLLNRVFPAELIPVREVLAGSTIVIAGGALVMIYGISTGLASWAWLLLPVILLLFGLATTALAWLLSLANLIVKDVQQILTYLLILLLIASPIAYTPQMLPGSLKFIIYLNPLSYYVMSFQTILVLGQVPPLELLAGAFIIGVVGFHASYRLFTIAKSTIADYV